MASYNDVTGDRLINIPKRGPREGQRREFILEMPVFEVFYCHRCHVKVSTSNGCCPCCGDNLKSKEALEKLAQIHQELGGY